MKTKFSSHSELAHVFAQQTHPRGEASNMFFEGDTIYSYGYHFPIAKFLDKNNVLLTLDDYSVTTSKHISIVCGALSHYNIIHTFDVETPRIAIKKFNDAVQREVDKLKNARKPSIYISNIMSLVGKIEEYQKHVKSKVYKKDYPMLHELLKQGYNYFGDDTLSKLKEEGKKEKERQAKALKKKVSDFKNFKTSSIHSAYFSYLRFNPKTEQVETSKGVKIDKSEARVVLNTWKTNPSELEGHKIHYYTIQRCTDKMMKAGCHTIRFDEAMTMDNFLNQ